MFYTKPNSVAFDAEQLYISSVWMNLEIALRFDYYLLVFKRNTNSFLKQLFNTFRVIDLFLRKSYTRGWSYDAMHYTNSIKQLSS